MSGETALSLYKHFLAEAGVDVGPIWGGSGSIWAPEPQNLLRVTPVAATHTPCGGLVLIHDVEEEVEDLAVPGRRVHGAQEPGELPEEGRPEDRAVDVLEKVAELVDVPPALAAAARARMM